MLAQPTEDMHPAPVARAFVRPFRRREAKYVFAGAKPDAPGPKHAGSVHIGYRWFLDCVTVDQLRRTAPFDAYSFRPGRRDGVRRLNEERDVVFYRATYRGGACVCVLLDGDIYVFRQVA